MKKRQVILTSLGNTLEWFDFALFIFFTPILSKNFFPIKNQGYSVLITLSIFALGFLCRPIGGILFGHAGDVHGRAKTLRFSILLITICTFLIGILPSYASIGLAAPLIFITIRLVQGISIGGEYSGVMIYLAESAPVKQRGFITSFAAIGANLGFLLATAMLCLLNYVYSATVISQWAWRIPFCFMGVLGLMLVYFRLKLEETPTFTHLEKNHHVERHPFYTALRYAPKQLLIIFGLTGMGSTLYYIFFGYMPTYLETHLHYSSEMSLAIESIFLVSMLFLVPMAGILGDFVGRKRLLIVLSLLIIIFAIPCFYLLNTRVHLAVILAFIFATILSSLEQGNTLAAVVENCPASIRYSGVAFAYNLGIAIFAGTAPLCITLITQYAGFIASGYYLTLITIITLIAANFLLSKRNINYFFE